MANDFEEIEVEEINSNAKSLQTYQQDKALVDVQIATARRYPRNLNRAIENAKMLACLTVETAKECTYTLVKGGKTITGPSVVLAKIIAQQFGNMRVEQRVLGYDDTHVTCEATCFDLERNYAIRTQMRKSIVGNTGKYSADMQVITGNALSAVALRNAIFAVVPKNVIDVIYQAIGEKIIGKLSDKNNISLKRAEIIQKMKDTYADFNLTDAEILKVLNRSSIDHIDKDDLITLIGIENAIKDRSATIEEVFRPSVGGGYVKFQTAPPQDKSVERVTKLVNATTTVEALKKLETEVMASSVDVRNAYDAQFKKLKK